MGSGSLCWIRGQGQNQIPNMTEPARYPENRLRETAVGERPQERLEQLGPGALSDTELLAMLLRSGTRGMDVLSLANRLIAEAGSLSGLTLRLNDDFRRHRGIGRIKALQLVTVMEIAKRILHQQAGPAPHRMGHLDLFGGLQRPGRGFRRRRPHQSLGGRGADAGQFALHVGAGVLRDAPGVCPAGNQNRPGTGAARR